MVTDKTHVAINQYQRNAIEAGNSAACGAFTIPFQIHTGNTDKHIYSSPEKQQKMTVTQAWTE